MEKEFKRVEIFAVITISLFIFASPAYLRYATSSEAAFLSSELGFGKADEENKPSDDGNGLNIFGSTAFFTIVSPETAVLDRCSLFFFHSPCFLQETFVLRC